MPPHDVVQRGLPHPVGIGSGDQLQKAIQRELNLLSTCKVVVFEPNDTINHTTRIKKEVWSLDSPFRLDKANIGNHLELIDDIAKSVAESIVEN